MKCNLKKLCRRIKYNCFTVAVCKRTNVGMRGNFRSWKINRKKTIQIAENLEIETQTAAASGWSDMLTDSPTIKGGRKTVVSYRAY